MDIDNSTIILILYCVLAFVLAFFPAYFIREETTAILNLARRPNLGTNALSGESAELGGGSEATPIG